jgi:hypothetical protein
MKNPICFSYFKKYLKNSSEDDHLFLYFWMDYYLYKNSFSSNNREKNYETAVNIYTDYFINNRYSLRLSTLTEHSRINTSSIRYCIDFPLEIVENIEEMINRNYKVDDFDMCEIFDDAFIYINNKLFNRYLSMFRNEEEVKKIEELICYIDFKID